MKYSVRIRAIDKKRTVAPFIDGFNVCDLRPKEYNANIERAIKNAYELGYKAAMLGLWHLTTRRIADWENVDE